MDLNFEILGSLQVSLISKYSFKNVLNKSIVCEFIVQKNSKLEFKEFKHCT